MLMLRVARGALDLALQAPTFSFIIDDRALALAPGIHVGGSTDKTWMAGAGPA